MNILQYTMIYLSAFGFSIIFTFYIFQHINLNIYFILSSAFLSLMFFTYLFVNKSLKSKIVGKHIIIQQIKYPLTFNQMSVKNNLLTRIIKRPLKQKAICMPKWAYYYKDNHEVSLYEPLNNLKYPLQLCVVKYSRSGLALVKNIVTNADYLVDLRNANYLV